MPTSPALVTYILVVELTPLTAVRKLIPALVSKVKSPIAVRPALPVTELFESVVPPSNIIFPPEPLDMRMSPATSSLLLGLEVPIPTLPLPATTNCVAPAVDPATKVGPEAFSFVTERSAQGVEEPMPTSPLFRMVIAARVDVAKASDDVPIYSFPPIDEKSQCFRPAVALVSESANDGRVLATWRFQFAVDVPMPTYPLFKILKSVVVAVAVEEEMRKTLL